MRILLVISTGILVFFGIAMVLSGTLGVQMVDSKISSRQEFSIHSDIINGIKSGELEPSKEMVIDLVENNREREGVAESFIRSLFNSIFYAGIFLSLVIIIQSIILYRIFKSRSHNEQ